MFPGEVTAPSKNHTVIRRTKSPVTFRTEDDLKLVLPSPDLLRKQLFGFTKAG